MDKEVKIIKRDTKENKQGIEEKINWVKFRSDLPSRGISYPENYEIHYKKYTFEEVQYFNSELIYADEKEKILFSLESIDCSFDKMNLAYYDLVYINIIRKLKCWSENYFLSSFKCPECSKDNIDVQTRLDTIEIKDLPEYIESLPISIEIQCSVLDFSILTVGDVLDLLEKGLIDDPIANFSKLIKNKSLEDSIELINNLSDGEDIDLINDIENTLDMNKGIIEINCKHCAKPVEVKVRDLAFIAEPFREHKKSFRDHILSSKT